MLITFGLGSVHAFSVFILPLESMLVLPRSQISLIYSVTLISLTGAVLLGYRFYALLPASALVSIIMISAAGGLYLASVASSWWLLLFGYGLIFGISNGMGYGFALQLVGRVMPEIKGFAMGAVTAAYAVGSVFFAGLFGWSIQRFSVTAAMQSLVLALFVTGLIAAFLLHRARVSYGVTAALERSSFSRVKLAQFWLAYMSSVFAGLMAIGHAAGIVMVRTPHIELATRGAMMIGVGSAVGGFIAGWLVDRWSLNRFLIGLPLLCAIALLTMAWAETAVVLVGLLCVVGFCYGAIIAIYPVAISNYFGEQGPRAYGLVFTAWGFAGLAAPWSAGFLFDQRADYELALMVAAAISLLSAVTAALCRLQRAN